MIITPKATSSKFTFTRDELFPHFYYKNDNVIYFAHSQNKHIKNYNKLKFKPCRIVNLQ